MPEMISRKAREVRISTPTGGGYYSGLGSMVILFIFRSGIYRFSRQIYSWEFPSQMGKRHNGVIYLRSYSHSQSQSQLIATPSRPLELLYSIFTFSLFVFLSLPLSGIHLGRKKKPGQQLLLIDCPLLPQIIAI